MKVPSMLLLMATLAATGCGREARSADPNGETRFVSTASATTSPALDERAHDLRGVAGARATERPSGAKAIGRPEMIVRTEEPPRRPTENVRSMPDGAEDTRDGGSTPAPSKTPDGGTHVPGAAHADRTSIEEGGPPIVRSDPGRTRDAEPMFDRALIEPEVDPAIAVDVIVAPRGTELRLRLEQELSSREHDVGDVFYAETSEDVLAPDGMVLIPIGTLARGRVWKSHPGDDEDRGEIELALDAFIIADREVPVTARVLETSPVVAVGQSGTEAATKVAAGAAAGAILGKILGRDTESAIHGAVAGAVAGTAVAIAGRDEFLVLEEGSAVVIRLEEEMPLPPR